MAPEEQCGIRHTEDELRSGKAEVLMKGGNLSRPRLYLHVKTKQKLMEGRKLVWEVKAKALPAVHKGMCD